MAPLACSYRQATACRTLSNKTLQFYLVFLLECSANQWHVIKVEIRAEVSLFHLCVFYQQQLYMSIRVGEHQSLAKTRLYHDGFPSARQEQASEELKVFLEKFGTLRIVDSGESTPDALFGKLNAVVVAMVQQVSVVCIPRLLSGVLHYI